MADTAPAQTILCDREAIGSLVGKRIVQAGTEGGHATLVLDDGSYVQFINHDETNAEAVLHPQREIEFDEPSL